MKLEFKVAVTNRYPGMTVIQVGYAVDKELYMVHGFGARIFVCLIAGVTYGEAAIVKQLQEWGNNKQFAEIIAFQRQNKKDTGLFDKDWEQHLAAFVYATQEYAPEVDLYSSSILEAHFFGYFEQENQYSREDFRDGRKIRCFLNHGRVNDGVIVVENDVVYVCTSDVQPLFSRMRMYYTNGKGSYLSCRDTKGYKYGIPIIYPEENYPYENTGLSGIQFVT